MERFCVLVKKLCRSKSELSLSASNALLRREQITHLSLLAVDLTIHHPDMPDPTSYPECTGQIGLEHVNFRLQGAQLELLHDTIHTAVHLSEITYWKRCKLTTSLTIGSVASQRRSYKNRKNHYVCYAFDNGACNFGSIYSFLRIPQGRQFALIRRWNGVERDLRVHQICIVGGEDGDWQLVELQHIICPIGLLVERDMATREVIRMIIGKPELLLNVQRRGIERP